MSWRQFYTSNISPFQSWLQFPLPLHGVELDPCGFCYRKSPSDTKELHPWRVSSDHERCQTNLERNGKFSLSEVFMEMPLTYHLSKWLKKSSGIIVRPQFSLKRIGPPLTQSQIVKFAGYHGVWSKGIAAREANKQGWKVCNCSIRLLVHLFAWYW